MERLLGRCIISPAAAGQVAGCARPITTAAGALAATPATTTFTATAVATFTTATLSAAALTTAAALGVAFTHMGNLSLLILGFECTRGARKLVRRCGSQDNSHLMPKIV